MSTGARRTEPGVFARWVRATLFGWFLGFGLIILLAIAWDLIGGGAQFMVGVGMGAGVGYMQGRVLIDDLRSVRPWFWVSVLCMGAPFVLWDLGALVGLDVAFSLPLCVVMGGVLLGVFQRRLLRTHFTGVQWWIPACVVGWGVPAGAIAMNDMYLASPVGDVLSIVAMLFGGGFLGVVTGGTLSRMNRVKS